MKKEIRRATLYGILDSGYVTESNMESVAQALLTGGVDVMQLRAKGYDQEGVLHLLRDVVPDLQGMCQKSASSTSTGRAITARASSFSPS